MTTYESISAWLLGVTVIAIIAGPIAAVLITRWGDQRREARRRQSEILSTLMRTRPARLSFEHVGALNLIQMEFHGIEPVQAAYSKYMAHLYESIPDGEAAQKRFKESQNDLFIELLHAMGRHLGYGFDKRDLAKLSYGPVGWETDETTARMLRSLSLDVLTGKQSLSVTVRPSAVPSEMFPPPPSVVEGASHQGDSST